MATLAKGRLKPSHVARVGSKEMQLRDIVEDLEERPLFQILILKNDEDQTVICEEVEELDLTKIKLHLDQWDQVFITRRHRPRPHIEL